MDRRLGTFLVAAVSVWGLSTEATGEEPSAFERDVRPVLAASLLQFVPVLEEGVHRRAEPIDIAAANWNASGILNPYSARMEAADSATRSSTETIGSVSKRLK